MMPIRFNYVYAFCVEFYTNLVNEMTVNEAFAVASEFVKKEETLSKIIWS